MQTTIAPPPFLRFPRRRPARRADLPAIAPPARGAHLCDAEHDFLVPNPRPDLTLDPETLAMVATR